MSTKVIVKDKAHNVARIGWWVNETSSAAPQSFFPQPPPTMLDDCIPEGGEASRIDFAMHGASMGADAVHVKNVAELKSAMVKARAAKRSQVLVIDTTHTRTTAEGGCWWEVGIPEVSERPAVNAAHAGYVAAKRDQRV